MILNINSDAVVRHTHRLEQMGRSFIPIAIRNTLNSAAFDVKTNTMPATAKANFIQRKPTFFKANSRVQTAKGVDIRSMVAIVGFQPKSGTDKSVDDLKQQEHGGSIDGRSFIPLISARTSGSWLKNVKSNMRISDVRKKIVDASKVDGKNDKEKFIKSAIHAGKGGFVLGVDKNGNGNRSLVQVRGITRNGRNTLVKSVTVFSVKGGRKVTPKATHFMQNASEESTGKMEDIFKRHAERLIK